MDSSIDTEGYKLTATQDWFSFNIETWRLLFPLVDSKAPRVLEVGSWEGRSTIFLVNELCGKEGEIVCIDHFDLMRTEAGKERYKRITHNLTLTGKAFRIIDQFSFPALMQILEEEMTSIQPGFDWVYVDGSHEADDTFLDGELAWRLAKKAAIFIFDDYDWDSQPKHSVHHPKRGIDAFMTLHEGEYQRLSSPQQYQMVLQKTSDMRIGFLAKEKANHGLESSLGYGMNVAYAINTAYVMAAAVSIRSLLEHSVGRISIYVVDCGLVEGDKEMLEASIPHRDNFTITFLALPTQSLTAEMGPVWAKLDLITLLPVERILYLDADTLIRADIGELWRTDMRGESLAAAMDVGYPMGYDAVGRARYFNAGVMLMDLTKIRAQSLELKRLAKGIQRGKYGDQDVLNLHFRSTWQELSLKWNAQGLGTYADSPLADRETLNMNEMKSTPCIVHFTGPVNPDVEMVLNPWVQPYTAKPWGYAGAPGHPFADEWWQNLEKTSWKGYRSSEEFTGYRSNEMDKAQKRAEEKMRKVVSSEVD